MVLRHIPSDVNRRQPCCRDAVAAGQIVLPIELRGVVGPALGLDDHRCVKQLEVGTGNEGAVSGGDDVLLDERQTGALQQPPHHGLKLGR